MGLLGRFSRRRPDHGWRERRAFSGATSGRDRVAALHRLGWTGIGECWISSGCTFQGPGSSRAALRIGDGSYLNTGCLISTHGGVTLGDSVYLGPGVAILTASHEIGGHDHRAGADTAAPVVIGSGTWIGARAVILPGVTIGEGVVVGAGAVVTRDCEADGVYVGSPARRVRDLEA